MAVDTANYIYNRIPHSGINNKIPFELLFKTKMDYSHFKVFGCKVFFFVPKSQRNKFDNNSLPVIFSGYYPLTNSYKILNISNNKIVLSRSVEFFEDTPGNSKISRPVLRNILSFMTISEIRGSNIYMLNKFNNFNFSYDKQNSHRQIDNSNKINYNNISSNNEDKTNDTTTELNQINTGKRSDNQKLKEPNDFDDIFNLPDKDDWLKAINEELKNMEKPKVFNTTNSLPSGANIISYKWVLKYKKDADGNIIKRKARLVARSFTQKYGIDYTNTFSPTLKLDSLRIIVALAVQRNYRIMQIDVNAAYLNANQNEDIYIKALKRHPMHNKGFLKFNKALCGLKQASREWNETLNNTLRKMGFRRLISEPYLYIMENE